MGTYLEVVAKPGCEEQINDAYAAATGKKAAFLVYSDKVIKREIAYIHSPKGKEQAHLRASLKTVEDWNRLFPSQRLGSGVAVKLSGYGEDEVDKIAFVKLTVKFVLEHRMLFRSINGLDDARDLGFCDFEGDLIEDNKTKKRPPSDEPTFANLPRGRSEFYRRCVEHNRPDLWNAYNQFKDNPCEDTWKKLRTKVIPWNRKGLGGLWGMVEELANARYDQNAGWTGRYRDGNVPPLMLVRAALRSN